MQSAVVHIRDYFKQLPQSVTIKNLTIENAVIKNTSN